MSYLARLRVLPKVMLLSVCLVIVAVALGAAGVLALGSLYEGAAERHSAGLKALLASQMEVRANSMNSAELWMAANPTNETIDAARRRIDEEVRHFRNYVTEFKKLADETEGAEIDQILELADAYGRQLKVTYDMAQAMIDVPERERRAKLFEQSQASLDAVGRLRIAVRSFTGQQISEINLLVGEISWRKLWLTTILVTITVIGAVACLAVAWLIGKSGISDPLNQQVGYLSMLAAGGIPMDVEGDDRKDEIGEMAQAMMVLRRRSIEVARTEGNAMSTGDDEDGPSDTAR